MNQLFCSLYCIYFIAYFLAVSLTAVSSFKFNMLMGIEKQLSKPDILTITKRVNALGAAAFLSGLFSNDNNRAEASVNGINNSKKKPTNEIVNMIDGIKQKRLGGGDIVVSEIGLGTQRCYLY